MDGSKIKEIRESKNMKQSELAEAVGVTQSMIAQIERGTKVVSLPLAKQIAAVLEVSVEEL